VKLRENQQEALDSILESFKAGNTFTLVQAPCGYGKTILSSHLIRQSVLKYGANCLFLAHLTELVLQTGEKLNQVDSDMYDLTRFYCSSTGKNKEIGQITIGSRQSVSKGIKSGHFDSTKFNLIIVDECFVGETRISTPTGLKRIDLLCSGDKVYNQYGIGTVEAVSVKKNSDLYEVKLDDGTKTRCTGNHPFFTESGWVEARLMDESSYTFSVEGMRMLWENVQAMDSIFEEWESKECNAREIMEQAKILLDIVLEENREPNEIQVQQGENGKDFEENKTQAYKKRRERAIIALASIGSASRTGPRMGSRIINKNYERSQERRLSELLQSGYCKRKGKNCNRDRWDQPSFDKKKRAGQEKGRSSYFPRVVSVSRIKRKSNEPVYNIQVSGHPSYFANGVAVHNCHLVEKNGANGQYTQIFDYFAQKNDRLRILGVTGTPFKTKTGFIYGDKPHHMFNDLNYAVTMREMIDLGYLCEYRHKVVDISNTESAVKNIKKNSSGDFKEGELSEIMSEEIHMDSVCKVIDEYASERKSIMVFAVDISHAELLATRLGTVCVHSKLNSKIWRERVNQFKAGEIRVLVNVSQLSIGFDSPMVDCIVMARPTMSPALYVQIAGRGLRLCDGKKDMLLLDIVNNYCRHGSICNPKIKEKKRKNDEDDEKKERNSAICPECFEVVEGDELYCPLCGAEMKEKKDIIERDERLKLIDAENKRNEKTIVQWGIKENHVTKKGNSGIMAYIRLNNLKTVFKFAGQYTSKEERLRNYIGSLRYGDKCEIVKTGYGDWVEITERAQRTGNVLQMA
jgi:superfamily II DNA or RNA helicase